MIMIVEFEILERQACMGQRAKKPVYLCNYQKVGSLKATHFLIEPKNTCS